MLVSIGSGGHTLGGVGVWGGRGGSLTWVARPLALVQVVTPPVGVRVWGGRGGSLTWVARPSFIDLGGQTPTLAKAPKPRIMVLTLGVRNVEVCHSYLTGLPEALSRYEKHTSGAPLLSCWSPRASRSLHGVRRRGCRSCSGTTTLSSIAGASMKTCRMCKRSRIGVSVESILRT